MGKSDIKVGDIVILENNYLPPLLAEVREVDTYYTIRIQNAKGDYEVSSSEIRLASESDLEALTPKTKANPLTHATEDHTEQMRASQALDNLALLRELFSYDESMSDRYVITSVYREYVNATNSADIMATLLQKNGLL
jgi:hypothetical protein